ncbi:DEAD-box ATP-dependent RNA helicase 48 [Nymphaea thermarum]|nr:DEAD-box ATP-dependent RNA helicase 48 [Nymphaea thermarum]
MGGGPRTFPGGLNKWQWKRMHEKKAREKEKQLLQQEKQLYEARVRSQIRSQFAGSARVPARGSGGAQFGAMTPEDHVNALADRFKKAGAEDLWNEDDGPLEDPVTPAEVPGPARHPSGSWLPSLSRSRGYVRSENCENSKQFASRRGFSSLSRMDTSLDCWKDRFRPTVRVSGWKWSDSFTMFGLRRIGGIFVGNGTWRDCPTLSTGRCCSNLRGDEGSMRFEMALRGNGKHSVTVGINSRNIGEINRGEWFPRQLSMSVPLEAFPAHTREDSLSWLPMVHNLCGKTIYLNSIIPGRTGRISLEGSSWRYYSSFRGNSGMFKKDPSLNYRTDRGISEKDMNMAWSRSDSDEEGEADDFQEGVSTKKAFAGGVLRNHDPKRERRFPKRGEGENEFSRSIRMQLQSGDFLSRVAAGGIREKEESLLSEKRFDEYDISPLTIKALSSAGYTQLTVVQEATLSICLEGKDALVKAKTGTGKTAAFLLPAIEAVLKASPSSSEQRLHPILVLVLCPTRELASQIAAEANVMLKYHCGIGVQTLIGGTRFKDDQKRLESEPSQIIVATPGRLLDHIENRSGFSVRLMGLKMLVLDEADLLLNLGFRKDIEKVVDCVPRQRQSMLFSATIPKEVRRISQLVLKKDHVYIDTVGLGRQETHAKVSQSYIVASHEDHFQIVPCILMDHIKEEPDYKVIVFCGTAMVTSLMYHLLLGLKMHVKEIHSRKPQLYRTRISDEFRESKRLILVSSDVSARGMDYPDVTLVVQVGIPSDREQYIHRLGRTGREGKDGKGVLLLAPWEEYFLDEIKDLPIQKSMVPQIDLDLRNKVEHSLGKIDTSIKEAAYHAWLGFYNSIREIGRDKTTLVELANQFCDSIGLRRPPAMLRKTASKMGLRNVPGIQIKK